MIYILILFVFISTVYTEQWDNYVILDPESKYHLWWTVSGDTVTFQVEVETKGWIGFGLSPNGGMPGSDVVIGWINANSTINFHDRYATANAMPIIDEKQNWDLLWGNENETHTFLRFKRLLETCDNQDIPIYDETMRVIFAYGVLDPYASSNIPYHGPVRRGTKSLYLINNTKRRKVEDPKDLYHWDLRAPNIEIPHDRDTEYYCTIFRRKHFEKKNHLIEVKPLIQPGNERFVHHMLLLECTGVKEEQLKPFLKQKYHKCYTEDQTPKFSFCFTVGFVWAVGGKNYELPEHVGMPFGESDAEWFVLEIHYDNPGFVKGIVDTSGLRVVYTPKLRTYDGSLFAIGNLWYPCIFVPPHRGNFTVSGHAHPACLSQRIPPEGIKVFGSLLHSHVLGKRIIVRHFRGDEELPPISSDNHYDFNFQQIRSLSEERTILPNDHLITECTYDSSKQEYTTFGGISTNQEMCIAFLLYYPKTSLSMTVSCPSPVNVVASLGVTKISNNDQYLISPITGNNESYIDFLNNYPWDDDSVNAVQNTMNYSPHLNVCIERGGKPLMVMVLSKYPNVTKTYTETNACNQRSSSSQRVSNERRRFERPSQIKQEKQKQTYVRRKQWKKTLPQIVPYGLLEQLFFQTI